MIVGEAELGDSEDDESFDEETGDVRRKVNGAKNVNGVNGHMDDSSEEDEDDDDEEAARAVREGFIVDEEEDDPETRERRRQERKKRRREERDEEEAGLDEEDLDLIGEANPEFERRLQAEPKLKRLKRGHKNDRDTKPRGVDDIFDDEEEEDRGLRRRGEDEFADFIEEDYGDEKGEGEEEDDIAVLRRPARNILGAREAAGLGEVEMEDMKEVFGNGYEYDWAIEAQEAADLREQGQADPEDPDALEKGIELKDVFEPSQLVDRMLTDEDNRIRITDQPERFQIARKPYRGLEMTEDERREEAIWISGLVFPKKHSLTPELQEPFQKAVAKVLEFMNTDSCEVPYIFQHRKDYLIHAEKIAVSPDPNNPGAPEYTMSAEKLLTQTDLWDIFENDLKFRALLEKRHALQRTYDNLQGLDPDFHDLVIEETLPEAVNMEELQDIQDYLHFQHSARLADMAIANGTQTNGTQRRPGASKQLFERIRSGKVYGLVRAFGITADSFAQNAMKKESRRQYTEDPTERPDDMADSDSILDPPDYSSGPQCLRAAKAMFAEEIFMSPRMRKFMRGSFFMGAIFDCHRTEKGLKRIDEQHPFYEIKYLRDLEVRDIAQDPARFLRMLKAEEEGLIEIRVRMSNRSNFAKSLYRDIESDNFSEVADAWNRERRESLDMALAKLEKMIAKGIKESIRFECENEVAKACRDEYGKRLDQAPYKPKGMQLGTVPRVLAMSNGSGAFGRDAICWAWVEEDGRVLENGKFIDLALGDPERGTEDGTDVSAFVELVDRRKPDVIGISGFSAETKKLFKQVEEIVERKDLHCAEFEDEDGNKLSDKLEAIIVNDEVARLYQTSDRATMEHPGFAPLTKYCVGLAKYLQNPLAEYASLGRDIVSISFDPNQQYVPQDRLLKLLETAMVDTVNLCGVDINEAVGDPYIANLLPYVCGLGPRKAAQLLKVINLNGGEVISRGELAADDEKRPNGLGANVWNNCASFLYIRYESSEPDMDFLDNTRVHPEDYDIGKKMASDALELDEEDVEAEKAENGESAIVRKLIRDEAQDKVNDLILEEYAEQLENNFNQRKRATLETIRAELQSPYEELRRNFALLSTDEIFTMFTGETRDTLCDGMIVPVSIKKVADDYVEAKMDCGIEGTVPALAISNRSDVSAKQLFSMHQTVQAKITYLNRKHLTANFSLREDELQRPYKRELDHQGGYWDGEEERKDKDSMMEKNDISGRTQRVIKHPLFKPFNATQAEEYLGSQLRGDLVIRPSSKGLDHLAVTWKVSDNIYQHIDVLELDKSNQLSSGTTLKVGGRYNYSDLDELIVNHVKAMAKKVEEMMNHEKYQNRSKAELGKQLSPNKLRPPRHHHTC